MNEILFTDAGNIILAAILMILVCVGVLFYMHKRRRFMSLKQKKMQLKTSLRIIGLFILFKIMLFIAINYGMEGFLSIATIASAILASLYLTKRYKAGGKKIYIKIYSSILIVKRKVVALDKWLRQ